MSKCEPSPQKKSEERTCSCTKLMYVPPGLLMMETLLTNGQPGLGETLGETDVDAEREPVPVTSVD